MSKEQNKGDMLMDNCALPKKKQEQVIDALSVLGELLEDEVNFYEVCNEPFKMFIMSVAIASGVDAHRKGNKLGKKHLKNLRKLCKEVKVDLDNNQYERIPDTEDIPINETIH